MPDRPHRSDEPARPADDPDHVRPQAGKPEQPADLPRRAEPGAVEARHGASGKPDSGGTAEWWKPFEEGRPRGPVKPWELARERYRVAENKPPRGSFADMKAQLEMLPPLDPSSPWNPDGTRRPKPPNPKDYELPLPSEADRAPDRGTPSWLDLLPSGDRVMLPRPRQSERHPHGPAETGRPPTDRAEPPAEVTHDDRPTPEPLTDAEWKAHRTEVKARLERARADGLATDVMHAADAERGVWPDERDRVHKNLIEELYSKAVDVPDSHQAVMAGGLAGAGKSTTLQEHADVDCSQNLTVNPDDIKELMAEKGLIPQVEGLSPMEASDLVHEESSYLAKQLAARAMREGKNVLWAITMASRNSTQGRIDDLRRAGYSIRGIFVDIPVDTSVQRADARHRHGHEEYRRGHGNGGRYVPSDVVRENVDARWGSKNRRTFEEVKHQFDSGWSVFDNSVDGRPPRLVLDDGRRRGTI